MLEATKCIIEILDAKYDQANLRAKGAHIISLHTIPNIKKACGNIKKEFQRLCDLGLLKWKADSEWALPTFIIPKKENTVRVICNFSE